MQSSRAVAGTDALSRSLTRRANQPHDFIIAKFVKATGGTQRRLFGVTSGENSLTDDRTLHWDNPNASKRSYSAWVHS
jgi:hypothetical protein